MAKVLRGVHATRQNVLRAIDQFDDDYPLTNSYQGWLENSNYLYALLYRARLYPPKYLLGQATDVPLSGFHGGNQTNRVLERLGFEIIELEAESRQQPWYLLTWNPLKWEWSDLHQVIAEIRSGSHPEMHWSCSHNKSIREGSKILLTLLGSEQRGLMGSGTVVRGSLEDLHYAPERAARGDMMQFVVVRFDTLLDGTRGNVLPTSKLTDSGFSSRRWTPQNSGVSLPTALAVEAHALLRSYYDMLTTGSPEDVEQARSFIEGGSHRVRVNRYERNRQARDACLRHYGTSCTACGIDFGIRYGPAYAGFMHVHHVKPLSDVAGEYEVDPIRDLRPVCPNCHSVIHMSTPHEDVETLRVSISGIEPN